MSPYHRARASENCQRIFPADNLIDTRDACDVYSYVRIASEASLSTGHVFPGKGTRKIVAFLSAPGERFCTGNVGECDTRRVAVPRRGGIVTRSPNPCRKLPAKTA
jgi:hypothetical protein